MPHSEPLLTWQDCDRCRFGHVYREYKDAIRHVRIIHFGEVGNTERGARVSLGTLASWLRDEHQYRTDQRLELYTTYIEIALRHMIVILQKAKYIREGVIDVQVPDKARYMLPSSLVAALECVVILLLYTARSFAVAHRYCNRFEEIQLSEEKETHGLAQLKSIRTDLEAAANVAKESMEKAKRDIMLMTFTDVDTGTVSYEAVGAEYILLTVMENLFNRPLHGTEQTDQVYASFVRKAVRNSPPCSGSFIKRTLTITQVS